MKDKEIESLQRQTQNIVKERDTWSRKLKEYKEQRDQYNDNNEEEFDYFRRALTDVINIAQQDGDSAEGDDEYEQQQPENDDEQQNDDDNDNNDDSTDYRAMLMAMANHMISDKMERDQLEAAIKMSLNQN